VSARPAGAASLRYFCTYFDSNYLPRGLAMLESLERHCPAFLLWVLCFDDHCHATLVALRRPNLRPIRQADFEAGDSALAAAKANRPRVQYFFTCTPSLPLFILRSHPEVDLLTYLDADLYFYSTIEPVFREMADQSVAIIEHRWPPGMEHMEVYGRFNVGLVAIRRDQRAIACLAWWRARCLESCDTDTTAGRYGDQKYLDEWPARFAGVVILHHKGANAGVWNLANYQVTRQDGQVILDEDPLIFFHFHGLKRLRRWLFDFHFSQYAVVPDDPIIRGIFAPYVNALLRLEKAFLRATASTLPTAATMKSAVPPNPYRGKSDFTGTVANLLRRNYGAVIGNRLLVPPRWTMIFYLKLRGHRDRQRRADSISTALTR